MVCAFPTWARFESSGSRTRSDPAISSITHCDQDSVVRTPSLADSIHRKNSPFYGPERFTYDPENNRYICPAGQPLNYGGRNLRNRTYAYIGTRRRCGACTLKALCTSGVFRFLAIHMDEPARQRARELVHTPEFSKAQRQRKKVEALFAELKNQIGLRRLRLRRMKFVREQFFLAAAAQN